MTAEEIAALEDAAKRSGIDVLLLWDRLVSPESDPRGMQRFRDASGQLVSWMKTLPKEDSVVMHTVMAAQIKSVIDRRKQTGGSDVEGGN